MYSYAQFFAGTYFYVRKVENIGDSEDAYYAIKASILLGFSEFMPLWGASFLWAGGGYFTNLPVAFVTVAALILGNCLIFCVGQRYVAVAKRYKKNRRRLMWTAMAIHLVLIASLAVPIAVKVF